MGNSIEASSLQLDRRNKGALTGTRVAGALGEIAMRRSLLEVMAENPETGWKEQDILLQYMVWVDNVYAVAGSVTDAISLLTKLEDKLRTHYI